MFIPGGMPIGILGTYGLRKHLSSPPQSLPTPPGYCFPRGINCQGFFCRCFFSTHGCLPRGRLYTQFPRKTPKGAVCFSQTKKGCDCFYFPKGSVLTHRPLAPTQVFLLWGLMNVCRGGVGRAIPSTHPGCFKGRLHFAKAPYVMLGANSRTLIPEH